MRGVYERKRVISRFSFQTVPQISHGETLKSVKVAPGPF